MLFQYLYSPPDQDGKRVLTEGFVFNFIRNFLSTLLVVPVSCAVVGYVVQWIAIMMVTYSVSELCSGWLSCPMGCNYDGYT